MAFLGRVFGKGTSDSAVQSEIAAKGFEVSLCSHECDDCQGKFPKNMKLDEDSALWNSTSPYAMHAVVATGKTDWPHDATGVSGTFAHAVASWGKKSAYPQLGETTTIKVTVGLLSLAALESNDEYINEKRGDVLLLPFFVWVKNLSNDNVQPVMDALVPSLILYRDSGASEFPVTKLDEFPEVVVEVDPHQAYVFLCSHRTRDKRCGITAPIMKKEMDLHLRELGLYRDFGDARPNGVNVSYINHIGGHKYAANMIIYLRRSGKTIWLARCTPQNVKPIVDECIVGGGKIWPEMTRIIQKHNPIEW